MTKAENFSPDHCPFCQEPLKKLDRIVVDFDAGVAILDDRAIILTPNQAIILDTLVNAAPRQVSRELLMSRLYKTDADEPEIKIIDVFVCKLRKGLVGTKYRIDTLWGKGYKLVRESK